MAGAEVTAAQLTALTSVPRPADAGDCGVARDLAGAWRVVWLRDGGRMREFVGPAFESVRAAVAASQWLREQHGLDR